MCDSILIYGFTGVSECILEGEHDMHRSEIGQMWLDD